VVEDVVVTVTVPASVRNVRVDPLILVTVPVSPPQKPPPKKDGAPKPAPANAPPHAAEPKPPRGPKDGLRADGDGLGLLAAAVFAVVGEAARVTMNPAVAPTTAMVSPTPNRRTRPTRLLAGSAGGGGGGGSGKSRLISEKNTAPTCQKGY
jgi:hypothetical protein